MRSLAALLLLASVPCGAADTDELEVLGFSPDGTYFAYQTHRISDGDGFSHATVRIVDVRKNSFVGKAFSRDSKSEVMKTDRERAATLVDAGPKLKELGIDRKIQGRTVFDGPISSEPRKTAKWTENGAELELKLIETPLAKSLVALILVATPGWEGADFRIMPVTGILP